MINSPLDHSTPPFSANRPRFTYGRANPQQIGSPVLSIVTSLSLKSPFLAETAETVLGQSLSNWEWIIAASTAHCDPRIIRYQTRFDPRVKIVLCQGDSATERFKSAVQSARAAMILFLACGDLLEPTAIEKLWWFLESRPESICARTYTIRFGELNRPQRTPTGIGSVILSRRCAAQDLQPTAHPSDGHLLLQNTIPEFLSWHRLEGDEPSKSPANSEKIALNACSGLEFGKGHLVLGAPANDLDKVRPKRRLLMLAPHLELGGADKFNLDLISCLQRDHNYEVTVVTTRSSVHRWRRYFERLTPDVFTLHTFLRVEDYPRFISYLIDNRKPDTVLITNCRIGYELLPCLRTSKGPSFVDYLHIDDSDVDGFMQLSVRYSALLDSTIVSSEHMKCRLIASGKDVDRIHVITTNIDPQIWNRSLYDQQFIRKQYGVRPKIPIITFLGRLCKQKRPDLMARTLKTIRDRGLDFVCFVIGDGEYATWLRTYVKRHNLEELRLLGALSNDEAREVLAITDILLMPSENEGIALAMFEAMSMSVPVVAANVGGQRELLTGDCGVLIDPGPSEITEYSDAIEYLLRNDDLRKRMGTRSRERICREFTLERMGDQMVTILEAVAVTQNENTQRPYSTLNELKKGFVSRGRFESFWATTLFLLSPRNFKAKLKNLGLLLRLRVHPARWLQVKHAFDPAYYLSHQQDVGRSGISPLLHYALQGYLEDRLPSPHFDEANAVCSNIRDGGVNPLLSSILGQEHVGPIDG